MSELQAFLVRVMSTVDQLAAEAEEKYCGDS
jgi:hypothetical protein